MPLCMSRTTRSRSRNKGAPASGRPAHRRGDHRGETRCRQQGRWRPVGQPLRPPALRIPRTRRESVSVIELIDDGAQLSLWEKRGHSGHLPCVPRG
jgi:hypothetical protein